ncbi:MarR family transcriptional regulator [bacterium]|nr:MarR family transcriptional regulator [bacterium]
MEKKKVRDLGETLRDEMLLKDKIFSFLKDGPKTIPDLSNDLQLPSSEVTMVLMAMRRYGSIEELPKSRKDDYFQYQLKQDD